MPLSAPSARTPEARLRGFLRSAVPRDAPVLAAVSGGSDSVALLACALPELGGRLVVVHVRHGLRAAGERDAEFVRGLCAGLGVPCMLVDAAPSPQSPGRTETAARRRRLAALTGAARALRTPWILLGQHLDDDLETLVLRLRRGHVGDRALAGMPVLRPLAPDARLLRPFLAGPGPPGRAELAAARLASGLPHVVDETNADTAIPRNAVRAWLAGEPPATRTALLALRGAARARLATRLARAADALAVHFVAEGLGSRLGAAALRAPDGDAPDVWRTELLRLLACALLRPRRLDPRAAVLRQLDARLAQGGALSVPASPAPLAVVARGGALHFPHEPPGPGDAITRAVAALLAGSLLL